MTGAQSKQKIKTSAFAPNLFKIKLHTTDATCFEAKKMSAVWWKGRKKILDARKDADSNQSKVILRSK